MMEIFPQMLISGASGLVGSALLNHFAGQSLPCSTLARRVPEPASSAYFWDPYHFEFREEMRRLNGIRAAIHLSGDNVSEGRWTQKKKIRIRQSRVSTTQAVVELLSCLEQRPEVLICASAVGYYGDRGEEVLTESATPGDGYLPQVCQEWEAASEAATNLGIRVVHLRFGIVLASAGGALRKMLPVFRLGMGGTLGNGQQWMSWISLPDVVRVVDFCINQPEIQGAVNVVANPVTNAEFTHTLAHHLHRPALIPAPAAALRLAFGEMADAALLASTRAIPARLLQAGFVFEHPTLPEAFQSVLPS